MALFGAVDPPVRCIGCSALRGRSSCLRSGPFRTRRARSPPMDRNPNIAFGGSVLAKLEGVNLAGNLFEQILPSVFKNNLLSLHEVQGRALFTSE